jgi:hypothetical protein
MIGFIVDHILGPFWPWIAGALAVVAGCFTARRSGVNAERAKRTAQDAKAYRETNERVSNETLSDDPDDVVRQRMRDRASRKP